MAKKISDCDRSDKICRQVSRQLCKCGGAVLSTLYKYVDGYNSIFIYLQIIWRLLTV